MENSLIRKELDKKCLKLLLPDKSKQIFDKSYADGVSVGGVRNEGKNINLY